MSWDRSPIIHVNSYWSDYHRFAGADCPCGDTQKWDCESSEQDQNRADTRFERFSHLCLSSEGNWSSHHSWAKSSLRFSLFWHFNLGFLLCFMWGAAFRSPSFMYVRVFLADVNNTILFRICWSLCQFLFGAAEREAYNAAERAERKQHTKEKVLRGSCSIKLKFVKIRSKWNVRWSFLYFFRLVWS